MQLNEQNRLTLQFHITGRCNLRCRHCYRAEGDVEPLTTDDIRDVIDKFCELRRQYNLQHGIKKRGHINLTGGEPFCRADIREIINYIHERHNEITYAVLSNGSFIDDSMTEFLKATDVSFVQLSIDGDRRIHDALRAEGDFSRVLEAARRLTAAGIRTHISFTANKENYRYLPVVAGECRKRHIEKLWTDRIVPIGNAQNMKSLVITKNDMSDYLSVLKKAQGNFISKKFYPETQVAADRALQFICTDGHIYSCSAGDSLITVDEYGRIMPCRRMPVICGDIHSDSLSEVYSENPVFAELRMKKIPEECEACVYNYLCRGGAKCQSYATYGSYDRADPACYLRKKDQVG